MPLVDLADLAAQQWGLVTTAQARSVGISGQSMAKLAGGGTLERMTHGVYRLTGAPTHPHDDLRAAWLALDPRRVVGDRLLDDPPEVASYRSAAVTLGLGDVDADRHEFTVGSRRQSRRLDVRFHRGALSRGEWTIVDGLPVTTAARAIRDLAGSQLDGDHLAGIVRDAIIDGRAHPDEVIATLRPFAHRYGAPLGDGAELVRRFLVRAGVPTGLTQIVQMVGADRAIAGRSGAQ